MIKIGNLPQFKRALERLRNALNKQVAVDASAMIDEIERLLMDLAGHAAEYPPPPSGSGYVRTRTLGRLWHQARPQISAQGQILDARIGNATSYGPYVQDPDRQAWMHQGRWQTTDDVVEARGRVAKAYLDRVGGRMVKEIANAV